MKQNDVDLTVLRAVGSVESVIQVLMVLPTTAVVQIISNQGNCVEGIVFSVVQISGSEVALGVLSTSAEASGLDRVRWVRMKFQYGEVHEMRDVSSQQSYDVEFEDSDIEMMKECMTLFMNSHAPGPLYQLSQVPYDRIKATEMVFDDTVMVNGAPSESQLECSLSVSARERAPDQLFREFFLTELFWNRYSKNVPEIVEEKREKDEDEDPFWMI